MGERPRRLGRGLSALIGEVAKVELPVGTGNMSVETDNGGEAEGRRQKADGGEEAEGRRQKADGGNGERRDGGGGLGIEWVDVGLVETNPFQPRREFDEEPLRQLSESILRSGVMQPVVARLVVVREATGAERQKAGVRFSLQRSWGDDKQPAPIAPGVVVTHDGRLIRAVSAEEARAAAEREKKGGGGGVERVGYQLVAGERRWRAARLGGVARIPAVIRELTDEEVAEWALVENVQRADLNPMEAAWGYRSLVEEFELTQGQVAERVGLDRVTVANAVRLTELEPGVQKLIRAGKISAGHGKALLAMLPGELRVRFAHMCAEDGWSVREMERRVAETLPPSMRVKPGKPVREGADLERVAARADLEKRLSEHLGTRVRIVTNPSGVKGRMVVEFFGLDQFDGVLERMGFRGEG